MKELYLQEAAMYQREAQRLYRVPRIMAMMLNLSQHFRELAERAE